MDQSLVQVLLHPSVFLTINVTLFICGILVLMMQPGFMLLETGSVSRKNAINNVFKNFFDMCLCGLFFWWIGYDILAGQSFLTPVLAALGLTKDVVDVSTNIMPSEPISIFFQLVFASTAVTITSGAVTGRVRPFHYIIYSVVFSAVIYPIVAFLVWNPQGLFYGVFRDFAGSAVVHALGGFAGLAGALLLKPRIGYFRHGAEEYGADVVDGLADAHQPHNLPLAALGVFFLWIGWFGFNAGTLFSAGIPEFTTLDTNNLLGGLEEIFDTFGQIIANTVFGPSAAVCAVVALLVFRREELDMLTILNAAIAGLVGITASADVASPMGAVLIGAVCGIAMVFTRDYLDTLKIDDPVGAFPAHGVPGLLGVTFVAFFPRAGEDAMNWADLGIQFGIGAGICAFAFASAYAVFAGSRYVLIGLHKLGLPEVLTPGHGENLLRVEPEIELEGLDVHVHGRDAYNIYDMA